MEIDSLTEKIIGCAIEVHRNLGVGLLESAYHQCLIHELSLQSVPFRSVFSVSSHQTCSCAVIPVGYVSVIALCRLRQRQAEFASLAL